MDCCEICSELPSKTTHSEFILRAREDNKRAYNRYTKEEVMLLILWFSKSLLDIESDKELQNISFSSYDLNKKTFKPLKECLNRLSINSGRSEKAILGMLRRKRYLKTRTSSNGVYYFRVSKKLIEFIKSNLKQIQNLKYKKRRVENE